MGAGVTPRSLSFMGNSVSELLASTYRYLGTPDQAKLNLGTALEFLLQSISFYLIDLQLSDENFLLKQYTFTPSRKDDDIVTAPGFSVPVLMEVRDANSTSDTDWRGILTANASDTQAMAVDGIKSVAFYGQAFQTMMRWSFDPVNDWQIEARLWYEPIANVPSALADSPKLSQAFTAMIALHCARACAPYCMAKEEAVALEPLLTVQLKEWEQKWKLWVNLDRNQTVVQRADFRGARRRRGGMVGGYGPYGGSW